MNSLLHLRARYLEYGKNWAIYGWFIPIANLYIPYTILCELYKESLNILEKKNYIIIQNITFDYLRNWWKIYIFSSIFSIISTRMSFNTESIQSLSFYLSIVHIDLIFDLAFYIYTINIVKEYSRLEDIIFELEEEEKV